MKPKGRSLQTTGALTIIRRKHATIEIRSLVEIYNRLACSVTTDNMLTKIVDNEYRPLRKFITRSV
jgi:hypothetical protein